MDILWVTILIFMSAIPAGRSDNNSVERTIIFSDKIPAPLAYYSQAVQVDNVLYISGNIGMTKDGDMVEGVQNQTILALDNIGHILEAAGITFDNVVKVTVMLSDMEDYAAMNKVYETYFNDKTPARSAFMATLPRGAKVEIEAVAIVGHIVDVDGQRNDAVRVIGVLPTAILMLMVQGLIVLSNLA